MTVEFDVVPYEYKEEDESQVETWCVLRNGRDTGEVFGTYAEAKAWVERQAEV